ncbi:MAG: methionyl-tRNA formyltransferase [Dehalococcoidia bacterium]|nr:methionyl-tRNA formyltransferase [Dehalococcoidia bacterium]
MRIVFMGTPEFAVAPLEYLVLNGLEVVAVYTQPDREAGRGRATAPPPVKITALKLGLPVRQPANLKPPEERAKLAELKPDVIVVAAFGQILSRTVLELPPHGCLNIHPSLLPKHRGVAPVPAAILNGDVFTGVSIMKLDTGVDTGPILARAQTPVSDWDTAGTLTEKLSRIGAHLLVEILPRWIQGQVIPRQQDGAEASYTNMIKKEDGEIDWTKPALEIWRRVRAYQPWPGSYTSWQGKQLKIIEAAVLPDGAGNPGQIVPLTGEIAFGVATGRGILGIMRVQMEGKRVMSSGEFLRGQRQLLGASLPGE